MPSATVAHQPGIGATDHERPYRDALDDDAPKRAGGQRHGTAAGIGQLQPVPRTWAHHGAQHHGGALREIHRAGDRVGNVKTQRDQPVDAAETEPGNDCSGSACGELDRHCEPTGPREVAGPMALAKQSSCSECVLIRFAAALLAMTITSSIHRHDLVALVTDHDVVVGPECVVVLIGEWRLVGLDQALIGVFKSSRRRTGADRSSPPVRGRAR